MTYKKKLIEVALPLKAINAASVREKSIHHGHPSTLHLWWARRPLATARAVIFAQMVDDPSAHPDIFKTEKMQEKERQRLFRLIEELVKWENTTNETVLQQARDEIWQSWRYTCAENADHPRAKELFDRHRLPAFHDPFAGGGALPLEAQRLGLKSSASDLNPVAVLINKAMIEIPPMFAANPPVNPDAEKNQDLAGREWKGAEGLAEDVRYYGKWMRDEAEQRIGHLYPKVEVTYSMSQERPDLKRYEGQELKVIAWIWARTVKSPNPAFASVDVPLASTFILSKMKSNEAYVEPIIERGDYRFTVKVGKPKDADVAKRGTKLSRGANFECLMSGAPISADYIKSEGKSGRMGMRLMAIVADGGRGRIYFAPTGEMEKIALAAQPSWKPETPLPEDMRSHWTPPYGLITYGDLFTARQLAALTVFFDLLPKVRGRVKDDALAVGLSEDVKKPLAAGGTGAIAYGDAVSVYLSFVISSLSDRMSSICTWDAGGATWGTKINHTFGRQGIPMSWDFAEANPFSGQSGSFDNSLEYTSKGISMAYDIPGVAVQADASRQDLTSDKVVSTDPPYYDNIGYADLSDFFYVWLRRSLCEMFPQLFTTLTTPKVDELIASPYRHGGKEKAETFFLEGMKQAMHRLSQQAHRAFPVTIYYAFKQSEKRNEKGISSTGWETFLDAVIHAGFSISGTWPIRTELLTGLKSKTNSLASSIILVCRQRADDSPTTSRREFVTALKKELPPVVARLQSSNIAPVDLAQAAIGPGMAIYTQYAKVIDAEGNALTVRASLALINQTLDEALAEQESDFDTDTRWALTWFEQIGFGEGDYGDAEQLSKSKNTSVAGLVEAGILFSKPGNVRLLKPSELPANWDPTTDARLTVWEMVHHLIRALEAGGESAAAELVAALGSQAEIARELCYRLYVMSDRKKRVNEAMAYNGLVQSWPEITRLARESPSAIAPGTKDLFDKE